MSVLTFEHKPFGLDWQAPAFLRRLFATEKTPGRRHVELNDLPDHLLLDIGIDPRSAPLSLEEAVARPDLAHGGVVSANLRTAAKS